MISLKVGLIALADQTVAEGLSFVSATTLCISVQTGVNEEW